MSYANFAVASIASTPSGAAGDTIVVTAGQGARFPSTPFDATIWPVGKLPDPTNAEVVTVTAVAGDTLTVTRGQESSLVRQIAPTDMIANSVTAKALNGAVRTDVQNVFTRPIELQADSNYIPPGMPFSGAQTLWMSLVGDPGKLECQYWGWGLQWYYYPDFSNPNTSTFMGGFDFQGMILTAPQCGFSGYLLQLGEQQYSQLASQFGDANNSTPVFAPPQPGTLANVNDCSTRTLGAIASGGGTFHVTVRRDQNANWIVIGPPDASGGSPAYIGVQNIFTANQVIQSSNAMLSLTSGPSQPFYEVTINPGAAAFVFQRNDMAGRALTLSYDNANNKTALSVASGVLEVSSNGGTIVISPSGGGGAGQVQFGRRVFDSTPSVGARVECWACTGQTAPVLATMVPGGAASMFAAMPDGSMRLAEVAFASLAAAQMGTLANVSDSTTSTPGQTVAGGGTHHVLARWNGANWVVIA